MGGGCERGLYVITRDRPPLSCLWTGPYSSCCFLKMYTGAITVTKTEIHLIPLLESPVCPILAQPMIVNGGSEWAGGLQDKCPNLQPFSPGGPGPLSCPLRCASPDQLNHSPQPSGYPPSDVSSLLLPQARGCLGGGPGEKMRRAELTSLGCSFILPPLGT